MTSHGKITSITLCFWVFLTKTLGGLSTVFVRLISIDKPSLRLQKSGKPKTCHLKTVKDNFVFQKNYYQCDSPKLTKDFPRSHENKWDLSRVAAGSIRTLKQMTITFAIDVSSNKSRQTKNYRETPVGRFPQVYPSS